MAQAIMAIVILIVLVYLMSFLLPIAKAQEQNQTLNDPENINVTSTGKAVYEQTNVTSDNQTILVTNGNNNTSENGANVEMLTNASQQPQALLQPLQQQPTLQQPLPPLPSPLNVIAPRSSPLQQFAQTLMQPSQQPPSPPLMQPSQQQLSTIVPPPSTPLYPASLFPYEGSNYQPPVILSQYSYVNNIGSMHIVGEVLNQAPVTAKFVKIIATFYNANGQVIGTDFTYADPTDLAPGQRAPFDVIALEGSVPLYQMSSYGLTVDSQ
jgi:hypothetical protein